MPLINTAADTVARQAAWVAKDSQTNALATASRAAETGNRHYVTGVSASYSAAAIGLLQIKDGTTVIWEHTVHNAAHVPFTKPLEITKGAAVSAEFAAGGAGVVGKVNLEGFTVVG